MPKILLFNPPANERVYQKTNVRPSAPSYPSLTLATLAGALIKKHEVTIIDLELYDDPARSLLEKIRTYVPDYVATSAVTAQYVIVKELMTEVKKIFPSVKTVVGGTHATVLSEEVVQEDCFDVVVVGEGDQTVCDLMELPLRDVAGILFKEEGTRRVVRTAPRELVCDINELDYPAWALFDLDCYATSHLIARKNPAGLIETSRGCAFQCNFCNKSIFGTKFRAKSPERVVDEMEYMLSCGFKEIHVVDDSFTQDILRAKEVCLEIIKRKLDFSWSLLNGVRVDCVDLEFFQLARKAGCWQVGFGIESGNQVVLDRVNKKISLKQVEAAICLAKQAGLRAFGFFILGLSGESKASMEDTIEFSRRLPLDIAKFDICIPLPGTPYYDELESAGRIRSREWNRYVFHHTSQPVYEHPNLDWATIVKYYRKAYRSFYFRPSFVLSRVASSIKGRYFCRDVGCLLGAKW